MPLPSLPPSGIHAVIPKKPFGYTTATTASADAPAPAPASGARAAATAGVVTLLVGVLLAAVML